MTTTRVAGAGLAAVLVSLSLAACGSLRDRGDDPVVTPTPPPPSSASSAEPWAPASEPCVGAGGHANGCQVPRYAARPFDVYVPSSYDPERQAVPLVVFLHGGGGNSVQTQETTCPGGDLADAGCLHNVGEAEGFITVYPNGSSGRLLPDLRTWNAGGGGEFACTSGFACANGIDDIAYLEAVLDEVEAQFRVDASRVYFMGFSNGAAMTHRVGCEMADRVAAIAPVSGSNSYATNADCAPARPMPVIYTHGTADPCWTYEASTLACLDHTDEPKAGAAEGVEAWVAADGCDADPEVTRLSNPIADGTRTLKETYNGCDGGVEVTHLRVEGGGHLFPGGDRTTVGGGFGGHSPRDWGVADLWDFLEGYSI